MTRGLGERQEGGEQWVGYPDQDVAVRITMYAYVCVRVCVCSVFALDLVAGVPAVSQHQPVQYLRLHVRFKSDLTTVKAHFNLGFELCCVSLSVYACVRMYMYMYM